MVAPAQRYEDALKAPGHADSSLTDDARIGDAVNRVDALVALNRKAEASTALSDALLLCDRASAVGLHALSGALASVGLEDDAAELFARSLAKGSGIELPADEPAIRFILRQPDWELIASSRSTQLVDALRAVAARDASELPPEHAIHTVIQLSDSERRGLEELVASPPIPSDDLIAAFRGG
jgi:hypothetical protein